MIACQRPIALQGTDYKPSSTLTNINTVKPSMKHPAPRQVRAPRPSKIQLPPLHDLSDWSFSPEHTSGPNFEDTTFDNSTLWARHRYLCFGDAKRSQLIFSSQIFDGEVACHTSLIRLRRECKDAELWIQVERQCHYTGAWTNSFHCHLPHVEEHIITARLYDETDPLTQKSVQSHTQRPRRRRSALLNGYEIGLDTIAEHPRTLIY